VFLPQSSDRRPLTRKPEWRKDGNLRTFKTYYGHHDIKVSVGESLLNQLKAAAAPLPVCLRFLEIYLEPLLGVECQAQLRWIGGSAARTPIHLG